MDECLEPDRRQPVQRNAYAYPDADSGAYTGSYAHPDACSDADTYPGSDPDTYSDAHPDTDRPDVCWLFQHLEHQHL